MATIKISDQTKKEFIKQMELELLDRVRSSRNKNKRELLLDVIARKFRISQDEFLSLLLQRHTK